MKESKKNSRAKSALNSDSQDHDMCIIKRIKKGDSNAFAEIIKKYRPYLYRQISWVFKNKEDTEDVLQEVFEKVFMKIRLYKPTYTFSAWITAVTGNYIIDVIRKRNMDMSVISIDEPIVDGNTGELVKMDLEAPQKINYQEEFNMVMNLVNELSERDQKIVEFFYVGCKGEEMSELLGINPVTIRATFNRIKHRIYEMAVERYGIKFSWLQA